MNDRIILKRKIFLIKIKYFLSFLLLLIMIIIIYFSKKKEKFKLNDNNFCETQLDPFYAFTKILSSDKLFLCKSENSEHFCYKNKFSFFALRKGVVCIMKNFFINPSNWKEDGYIYNGPINKKTKGSPLIRSGFFNMKCNYRNNINDFSGIYKKYFNSWNYYKHNNDIINYNKDLIKELSPGKTVFILSRNQDSPNLFHGGSEFISAFTL